VANGRRRRGGVEVIAPEIIALSKVFNQMHEVLDQTENLIEICLDKGYVETEIEDEVSKTAETLEMECLYNIRKLRRFLDVPYTTSHNGENLDAKN
jgi:hypothetical protein